MSCVQECLGAVCDACTSRGEHGTFISYDTYLQVEGEDTYTCRVYQYMYRDSLEATASDRYICRDMNVTKSH